MIEVQIDAGGFADAPLAALEAGMRAALAADGATEGEISLALLGDDAMREMNRRHLGHDRVTDVLAFALWEEGEAVLGDVYVGLEQARRQAREAGVALGEELLRLAVHGTLHVLGWDHPVADEDRALSPMYERQEAIVARIQGGR